MFPKAFTKLLQACLLSFACLVPLKAYPVAYCALRDPVFAIQTFYPGSSSFRSFLGTVGPDVRQVLTEKLPHQLHFNEFGKHTLYVAYEGEQPVGLVHARTEKGDWGLDELVWSFNMDMTVHDFRFQRSRSRWRNEVQSPAFKQSLQGKGFEELRQMLSPDGASLAQRHPALPQEAQGLAAMVVRSALKTIIVTESVWRRELESLASTTP
jgi:hypothetical protein